jgi:hypothetical protein
MAESVLGSDIEEPLLPAVGRAARRVHFPPSPRPAAAERPPSPLAGAPNHQGLFNSK